MRISRLLRYPEKKKGVSAIYFTASYRGERAIIYPGESIDVANWINDFKKKIHKPRAISENNALIGRLNRIEQLIRDTHDELQKITNGVVSHKALEKAVHGKLFPPAVEDKNKPMLITDFFQKMYDDSKSGQRKTNNDMYYKHNHFKDAYFVCDR